MYIATLKICMDVHSYIQYKGIGKYKGNIVELHIICKLNV